MIFGPLLEVDIQAPARGAWESARWGCLRLTKHYWLRMVELVEVQPANEIVPLSGAEYKENKTRHHDRGIVRCVRSSREGGNQTEKGTLDPSPTSTCRENCNSGASSAHVLKFLRL